MVTDRVAGESDPLPSESGPGGEAGPKRPGHQSDHGPGRGTGRRTRPAAKERDNPGPDSKQPVSARAAALGERLRTCMESERGRLRRRIGGLIRAERSGKDIAHGLDKVEADIGRSQTLRQWRGEHLPSPEFPLELPVSAQRDDIAAAIRDHQVVIVAGETGSGKTTQLPKICLSLGRGVGGLIGCTQPRRIAAVSVAARVAQELGTEVGEGVGYRIRFGGRGSPRSFVRFMTDGVLLAETQGDRRLNAYDTLIVDEAHERSLNIDFLLGYLKQLLHKRPDLKVIVSSATLDTERFSEFFDAAPVVRVEGRTYPVDVRYRPPEPDTDLAEAVADAVTDLHRRDRSGDLLVFLSGERDIREAAEALGKRRLEGAEVLPLYARLSQAEQQRVFRSGGAQKIILATNVAETSLTIPGIRYVVDAGLARIHRYSYRTQVSRLQIEPVSQASCNQRAGRCGRVGPGVCVRLYEQEDYQSRPEFTDPEIKRSSLAEVILRMKALDLGEVEDFPFLEPPTPRMIKEGYRVLEELGALNRHRGLSEIGRHLARLPIDPRLGRMVLAAGQSGALREVLPIAAFLSIQDPRERPLDKRQKADQRHAEFQDQASDFLTVLALWRFYLEFLQQRPTRNRQRKLCRERFLSYPRMLEWRDIHQQLESLAEELGLRLNDAQADYAAVHGALATGLLSRLGTLKEHKTYLGARQMHFALFPGSGLFKRPPKWVMCGELVDTAKLYGRMAAKVDPAWIEPLAGHLVHRNHTEPHWEKRRGQVTAFEQVTLYGLPIVVRRRVDYGPIDPPAARELFLRDALVAGEFQTREPFLRHNLDLIEQIEALEHKSRRRDVLADEQTLYEFYAGRIPETVYDARTFTAWWRGVKQDSPRRLHMRREDLMRHEAETVSGERFPDHLDLDGLRLALEYRFEPADPNDGVTLTVPAEALAQLRPDRFDWLVPGLLGDRIAALIKTLPKALRRNFVPAPDFARAALEALEPSNGALLPALTRFLLRLTGVEVPPDAWRPEQLPDHLRMNYRVVDGEGTTLGVGRDLENLRERLIGQARQAFRSLPKQRWERDGLREWDLEALPERVEIAEAGRRLPAYPALMDGGEAVGLRLFDTPERAEAAHREGLRRLFALRLGGEVKRLRKALPFNAKQLLAYSRLSDGAQLADEVVAAALDRAFLQGLPLPRDKAAFESRLAAGRSTLHPFAQELARRLGPILEARAGIAARLDQSPRSDAEREAWADLREQLAYLFPPGFIARIDDQRLRHYPRYLKAQALRLDKLGLAPGKDAQKRADLAPYWRAFTDAHQPGGRLDPEAEDYRWMLEELRVSLFAQELGTARPVSPKRLRNLAFWGRKT